MTHGMAGLCLCSSWPSAIARLRRAAVFGHQLQGLPEELEDVEGGEGSEWEENSQAWLEATALCRAARPPIAAPPA